MKPDADLIRKISRFLNLAENDSGSAETEYGVIYIYGDGNGGRKQVTLARGFTEDGGNLAKVVRLYLASGGKNEVLTRSVDKIGRGVLARDQSFIRALKDAAKEQVMRDAQDAVFQSAYLGPAFEWAENRGFQHPLSYAVAADSFLHSGRMTPKLVASFPEPPPSSGGNEKTWMKSYLNARLAWFERVSGALHTCTFRPKFFLGEISANNWLLDCPLNVIGKGRIC